MDAELKGVEVEAAVVRDDEFAVEHTLLGKLFAEGSSISGK